MKKIILIFSFIITVGLFLLSGCTEYIYEYDSKPVVVIENIKPTSASSVVVKLVPNELTKDFSFVIGLSTDVNVEDFLAGSIEGTQIFEGEQEVEVKELMSHYQYTIMVVGRNEDGEAGSVISRSFIPNEEIPSIDIEFVSYSTVAFELRSSSYVNRIDYIIAEAGIENIFENDMYAPESILDKYFVYIEKQELKENTDYEIYYRTTNRAGEVSETYQLPFSTPLKSESPQVSYSILNNDPFMHTISFQSNEHTSEYMILMVEKGTHDAVIYGEGFGGNVSRMMQNWYRIATTSSWNPGVYMYDESTERDYITYLLNGTQEMELFIMTFDKDGEVFGVEKFMYTLENEQQANLETEVVIDEIILEDFKILGEYQAEYTFRFKPNADALGVFYSCFLDTTLEMYLEDPEYPEGPAALRALMHQQMIGAYQGNGELPWTYTNGSTEKIEYTETALRPSKEYTLVVLPISLNGSPDYGDFYLEPFRVPDYK